jgi:hypothetical protein
MPSTTCSWCTDPFASIVLTRVYAYAQGGSWISTGNEATRHARYAFRRHFQQFAGIRYVESEREVTGPEEISVYELDAAVNQYAAFHYDDKAYFNVPNFARSVAEV